MSESKPTQAFDFAFFGAVPFDHLLRGRTGALVDNLRKRGFFIYYFEIPPASVLQYIKDPISHNRGLINFLFPRPRRVKNALIFSFPPILPAARYESGWIRRVNRKRLLRAIQNHCQPLVKQKRPVVALVVTPWWWEVIRGMDFSLLCYDCIDDLRVFCKEEHLSYFSILQRELVARANLILISAQKLRDDITAIRPDAPIEFLPNGVDFDFFISKGLNALPPAELAQLKRPIIGFVGSLFKWIDTNLILTVASSFPTASVVLVGPVQDIKIPNLSNIRFLGPKPYPSIPAYINSFDVCLIPFIKDPLSDKVDPIKVYEYLSLGKPVVAINLPELERVRHLIYLAKDSKDFIRAINLALQEQGEELKMERIKYARENSWQVRVDRLLAIIENKLAREG